MKSDKTVRRLIEKKKAHSSESGVGLIVKEKGRIRLHKELLSLYVSDYYLWLERNGYIRSKTKAINENAEFFKTLKWTWFCYVSYEKPYNVLTCHSIMNRFFERLQSKFPAYTFRMLFASERNQISDNGYHNHFVDRYLQWKDDPKVKDYADSYFPRKGNSRVNRNCTLCRRIKRRQLHPERHIAGT